MHFIRTICEQLWELVSDDSLRVHQNDLMQRKPLNGDVLNDSLFSSLLAMKVMASLMLHHLAGVEDALKVSQLDKSSEHVSSDIFEFQTSCILSGLVSVCNMFMVLNKNEQKNYALASSHSMRHDANMESIACANVLSNGCFWLTCILNYSRSILVQLQSNETLFFVRQRIAFMQFSKNVLWLTNPVLYKCLTEIKQAPNLGLSSDLCLRSCLALLRGAVGLRHEADNINPSVKDSSCNSEKTLENIKWDTQCPSSQVIGNDELTGGIDDDTLMNIDLESVANGSISTEINSICTRRSIDSSTRDIWKLFVQTLEQAKPSLRYMVPSYVVGNNGRMSTHGRVVWGRHAGGICAALASLCTLESQGIVKAEGLFKSHLFQLPRRKDSDSVTKNDKIYHRQVGQCFSAELCKVARISRTCLSILSLGVSEVLNTCIEALTDASILNRFPTINSSLLIAIGGERSKEKEKIRLEAIHEYAIDAGRGGEHHPDLEASGIRRQKKDVMDTPGPSYMSTHMWSFCSDLGHSLTDISLLESQSENREKLGKLGVALVKSDDDLPLHIKLVCSEALQALPISLERECMKRIMKLRNIFSAILHKPVLVVDSNSAVSLDGVDNYVEMVSLLIKALLDQLINIATGVHYYEKNGLHEDLHIQTKARVLQFTYAQFVVFLLTWLLRELAFTDSRAQIQAKFIWDCLFVPSLKLCGFDASSLKQEISTGILLDASPSFTSTLSGTSVVNTHGLSSISEDLFTAVNSCISSLVVPIASGLFHSSESTTMYELINVDLSRKCSLPSLTIDIIPLLVPCIENEVASTANDLSGALNIYLSLTSMGNMYYDKVQANAMTKFRRFALRKLMVPKLRHDVFPREKKIRILHLLKKFLDVEAVSTECAEQQDFEISLNDNCNSFLDLSDCCYIVNALSLCIIDWHIKKKVNDTFSGQVFLCCRHILKLQIEVGKMSLMAWCRINAEYNTCASYLKVMMEWIFEVAGLLTGPLWKDSMKYLCYLTGTNGEKLNTKNLYAEKKVFCQKLEHWQSLAVEKGKLEKIIFESENESTTIVHSYHKETGESQRGAFSSLLTLEPCMIKSANDFIMVYLRT